MGDAKACARRIPVVATAQSNRGTVALHPTAIHATRATGTFVSAFAAVLLRRMLHFHVSRPLSCLLMNKLDSGTSENFASVRLERPLLWCQ